MIKKKSRQFKLSCANDRHPSSKNPVDMYCPGHFGVNISDRADRLAGKETITSVLRLGRCEVLRQKAKDITPSIAWRRETWKEEALDDLS